MGEVVAGELMRSSEWPGSLPAASLMSAETTAAPVLDREASTVRPPLKVTAAAPGLASGWLWALCCSSPGLREASALQVF